MPAAFTDKSVLITGANGFIGSRLCRFFLSKEFRVLAGVRKSADLTLLQDVPVEYRFGDILSPDSLPQMVTGVNYIIHNAGIVKANTRQRFFDVNETGTRNLFEAVIKSNPTVKKLMYISSLAAAGPSTDGRDLTEQDTPHPITVYGESKLAGEKIALSYADRLNVVSLRPSGVYGPGDKEMFTVFRTVNNRIKPLFGDLSRKLQLVHVDDLCLGVYRAVVASTAPGSVYFIAEKNSYSMAELVELLVQASGRKGFPLRVPSGLFKLIAAISETALRLVGVTPMLTREKSGELLASWQISTARAAGEIGFESTITFAEGARQTYQWYREHRWLS
jgi:nucleoside-diphosphate-sugar epimerase